MKDLVVLVPGGLAVLADSDAPRLAAVEPTSDGFPTRDAGRDCIECEGEGRPRPPFSFCADSYLGANQSRLSKSSADSPNAGLPCRMVSPFADLNGSSEVKRSSTRC
jgi:hypothetical protein